MRRILFGITTVLLSTLFALIVCEVIIRIALPPYSAAMSDPVLGIKGRPGGDMDSRGFRNPAALDTANIVVLGDSQTYGNNASRDDAWPEQLSQLASTTVYQMAFGGWSIAQYDALIDPALALKPKTLIIALYTGNDMLETTERVYAADRFAVYRDPKFAPHGTAQQSATVRYAMDSGTAPHSFGFAVYMIRTWLRANSRVYALLGDATRELRVKSGIAESDSERSARIDSFLQSRPDLGYQFNDPDIGTTLSPSYRLPAADLTQPDVAEGWRLTQLLADDIQKRVPDSTSLVFVLIPTKELVYIDYMHARGIPLPAGFAAYETAERSLVNKITTFMASKHLRLISVEPALENALEKKVRVYSDDDNGHPIAAGYTVIANAINTGLVSLQR